MELKITKGGNLVRTDKGVSKDVTDSTLFNLMEVCELEEDVTLRDIFLLLQRQIDVYSVIINNNVKEIVEEGLSGKKSEPVEKDCVIDYLELRWNLEAETKYTSFGGHLFPEFHGWGDWPEDEHGNIPAGTKGGIGIDFTPTYDLIDYPVKLCPVLKLTVTHKYKYTNAEIRDFQHPSFSLFHILYGIIWELSYFGAPAKRTEKLDELLKQVAEIEEHPERLIPINLVMKDEEDNDEN